MLVSRIASPQSIIFTVLVLLLVPVVAAESPTDENHVFTVELSVYNNGTIDVERFDITDGSPTMDRGSGAVEPAEHGQPIMEQWQDSHWLAVTDDEGRVLSEQTVSLPFPDWSDAVEADETIIEREHVFRRLAYTPEAERIHLVRGEGEVLYTIDIPSMMCVDDGTCHFYCDGRSIDPDCDDQDSFLPLIVFILLFIGTGTVLYHIMQRSSLLKRR